MSDCPMCEAGVPLKDAEGREVIILDDFVRPGSKTWIGLLHLIERIKASGQTVIVLTGDPIGEPVEITPEAAKVFLEALNGPEYQQARERVLALSRTPRLEDLDFPRPMKERRQDREPWYRRHEKRRRR